MAPHQLIYLLARGCFEPGLHLFTHHWGCQRHEQVCATARVPPCAMDATTSSSGGNVSVPLTPVFPIWLVHTLGQQWQLFNQGIIAANRRTNAQAARDSNARVRAEKLEAESAEAWKWIPPLWRTFTCFNRTPVLLAVGRDYSRGLTQTEESVTLFVSFLSFFCFIFPS